MSGQRAVSGYDAVVTILAFANVGVGFTCKGGTDIDVPVPEGIATMITENTTNPLNCM